MSNEELLKSKMVKTKLPDIIETENTIFIIRHDFMGNVASICPIEREVGEYE